MGQTIRSSVGVVVVACHWMVAMVAMAADKIGVDPSRSRALRLFSCFQAFGAKVLNLGHAFINLLFLLLKIETLTVLR